MMPKQFYCSCCNPPCVFSTARDRWNHKYYKTKKSSFVCEDCSKQLSSMQKLMRHNVGCKKMMGKQMFKKKEPKEARMMMKKNMFEKKT